MQWSPRSRELCAVRVRETQMHTHELFMNIHTHELFINICTSHIDIFGAHDMQQIKKTVENAIWGGYD